MLITSVKPKLSREQAIKKMKGPLRRMRRGRLEKVVDFYIPYRLFEVSISNAGDVVESLLAVDSVAGELDLYSFDQSPAGEDNVKINTERAARATLAEARSFEALKEKVSRSARLRGLFRRRSFRLEAHCVDKLYIPYWVGVYGQGDDLTLDVLDGLKGTFGDTKVRDLVAQWLKQPGATQKLLGD